MTIIRIIVCFTAIFFLQNSYAGYFVDENSDYDAISDFREVPTESMNARFAREFPSQSYEGPRVERRAYQQVRRKKVHAQPRYHEDNDGYDDENSYSYNLPSRITTSEKVIVVDPNIHAWGAYSSDGKLLRAGLATAGARWCRDINRGCKTKSGVFRIYSLGSEDCYSTRYPIEEGGGAPMPYCMYFNGSQGLHGSNNVVRGNISHGCVRLRESDAHWIRYSFAGMGTKVVIKPY